MDELIKKTKNYTVGIRPDEQYGYFESNSDDEYDYVEGGLWFENDELVDFDGTYSLPIEVIDAIIELGFRVDKAQFCDEE